MATDSSPPSPQGEFPPTSPSRAQAQGLAQGQKFHCSNREGILHQRLEGREGTNVPLTVCMRVGVSERGECVLLARRGPHTLAGTQEWLGAACRRTFLHVCVHTGKAGQVDGLWPSASSP